MLFIGDELTTTPLPPGIRTVQIITIKYSKAMLSCQVLQIAFLMQLAIGALKPKTLIACFALIRKLGHGRVRDSGWGCRRWAPKRDTDGVDKRHAAKWALATIHQ